MKTFWVNHESKTRAVVVNVNGSNVVALKYVGVTTGNPAACPHAVVSLRWQGKTEAGARRWAAKVLTS